MIFEIIIRTTKPGQLEEVLASLPRGLNPQINRIAEPVTTFKVNGHAIGADLPENQQRALWCVHNGAHRGAEIQRAMPDIPKGTVMSSLKYLMKKGHLRKSGTQYHVNTKE